MLERLASAGVLISASASAASVTATVDPSPIAIFAPVLVACVAACFARFIAIFGPQHRKKKEWRYETAIIGLCVLVSGALAYDHAWTVGMSAMYGGGIGGIGAGMKPILEGVVRGVITSWASAMNPPPPSP